MRLTEKREREREKERDRKDREIDRGGREGCHIDEVSMVKDRAMEMR